MKNHILPDYFNKQVKMNKPNSVQDPLNRRMLFAFLSEYITYFMPEGHANNFNER